MKYSELKSRAFEAEKERDELKIAVAEANASIKTLCRDWAEDDTSIKEVCAKFGIDTVGDSYGVPAMADCVEQLGLKTTALIDALKAIRELVMFHSSDYALDVGQICEKNLPHNEN